MGAGSVPRALLRALLRAARRWDDAVGTGGTARAREPVNRGAFAGRAHGWSLAGEPYAAAAAAAATPPGVLVPPTTGHFERGDLARLILTNFRAAAAAGDSTGAALDAGFAALLTLADQADMEACSSRAVTRGVCVDVTSAFLGVLPTRGSGGGGGGSASSSSSSASPPGRRVFTYRIRITNSNPPGSPKVQILSRGWTVRDVRGEVAARVPRGSPGIVGCTPTISPGDTFEYHSSTEVDTDGGSMEGEFGAAMLVEGEGGGGKTERFSVEVAQFALRAPPKPR